jgi:uncharacterized membrane protein
MFMVVIVTCMKSYMLYFSTIRQDVVAAGCFFVLLCGAVPASAQMATQEDDVFYISFQVPGSTGTFPQAINEFASVTGDYLDASGRQHGFVRDISGKIDTFDAPDSTLTAPTGINEEGTIAGYYRDAKQVEHGFVRSRTGKIKAFDPPGSIQTVAEGINAKGTIVGSYQILPLPGNYHSFVRDADGAFTTFDPPGCATSFAQGVNREGGITGYAQCPTLGFGPNPIPFLRDPEGTAKIFPINVGGWALSINKNGIAAGYLRGTGQAFLLSPYGSYTEFDISGSAFPLLPPISINPKGIITGTCIGPGCGAGGYYDAFVISPSGKVTSFNVPVGDGEEVNTEASSINTFGVITGWYSVGTIPIGPLSEYGFLRVPSPHRHEH